MSQVKPRAIANEDDLIQILERSPILTSQKAGWNNIFLGHFRTPAYEAPEVSSLFWHSLLIFPKTEAPIQAQRTLDGKIRHEQVIEGDIVITPAQVSHRSCWNAEHDFIVMAIASDVFARAIDESAESSNVELLPQFAISDGLVLQIGLALKQVLENNPQGSRLYAETMANALAVHLLQNYSARQPILRDYNGGLSKHQLRQVIDYINGHLDRDLGLAELAKIVQMSPHYFTRLFKQSTGLTPHQYVIRRRVERAKELLLNGELSIAEVAYSVGFANQSHLNRHLKRLLGVTPRHIRQG
ncbi:helix-turn-helix transcriptional regulator [Coleofasciculus sp. FACHB-64]|uniref:helix-turn-helix domain-containing protein n=1 Tax=Cyanophyceae TaxID=3028117 RepID=UPI0016862E56|nr:MULTISPECIES: AraC family transcriptional regulator [unclassified Coleofasciculus]MBD1838496.1 helix-turn-helix transcriptional regulator [Coleofasciculus sp. FACHB-501]MBD2045730.1 helix-turn-helix transcriptional regulator [Coleofasciculus sp. FACHB-64]